jgi:hypothetical protein
MAYCESVLHPSGSQHLLTSSAGADCRGEPDEGDSVRLRDALKRTIWT